VAVTDRSSALGADGRSSAARYLGALREHWLLIVGLVVLSVVVAVAYVETATPRYESEADILITPVSDTDPSFLGFSLLREGNDPSRAVLTAARLVGTPEVAQAAAKELGPGADNALAHVTVTPVTQSSVVAITGQDSSADMAAAYANAVAAGLVTARTAEFQNQLNERITRLRRQLEAIPVAQRTVSATASALETQLGTLTSLLGSRDPTLQVLTKAVPAAAPAWPRKTLSVGIAFMLALVLGCGLALALELVSPKLNREDELLLDQRLPILARIPQMPTRQVRAYLAGREPLPGAVREAYRTLRASLASGVRGEGFPETILVTSASPGDGKTMTSVNLATTLAIAGQRVILVDGDLRRPMVATVFGIGAHSNGFADVLTGDATLEDALVEAPGYGQTLRLLLATPDHAHLVDLLLADRVEAVIGDLRAEADVVVLDSPPLAEVADALGLADVSDAVLVAVRLGRTRRDKLDELRRMLARHGISPTGFVVTQRRRRRSSSAYYSPTASVAAEPGLLAAETAPVRDPEAV
jgi:succinoglycan biosynthesis transport protein ExoP